MCSRCEWNRVHAQEANADSTIDKTLQGISNEQLTNDDKLNKTKLADKLPSSETPQNDLDMTCCPCEPASSWSFQRLTCQELNCADPSCTLDVNAAPGLAAPSGQAEEAKAQSSPDEQGASVVLEVEGVPKAQGWSTGYVSE